MIYEDLIGTVFVNKDSLKLSLLGGRPPHNMLLGSGTASEPTPEQTSASNAATAGPRTAHAAGGAGRCRRPCGAGQAPRSLEECVVAAEVGSRHAGGPGVIEVQCQPWSEATSHGLGAETVADLLDFPSPPRRERLWVNDVWNRARRPSKSGACPSSGRQHRLQHTISSTTSASPTLGTRPPHTSGSVPASTTPHGLGTCLTFATSTCKLGGGRACLDQRLSNNVYFDPVADPDDPYLFDFKMPSSSGLKLELQWQTSGSCVCCTQLKAVSRKVLWDVLSPVKINPRFITVLQSILNCTIVSKELNLNSKI